MTEMRESTPAAHEAGMKTYGERYAVGKARRETYLGEVHAAEKAPSCRPDRVQQVLDAENGRLPDLWRSGNEVLGTLIDINRRTVHLRRHSLDLVLAIFILVGLDGHSPAQLPTSAANPTAKAEPTIPVDPLGRDTPRSAMMDFGKLLERVEAEGRSLVIEKRGTPRAVLLSLRDYVRLAVPEPEVLR
jgi:prevent-host-death family protein